jgi:hypothetical protein
MNKASEIIINFIIIDWQTGRDTCMFIAGRFHTTDGNKYM